MLPRIQPKLLFRPTWLHCTIHVVLSVFNFSSLAKAPCAHVCGGSGDAILLQSELVPQSELHTAHSLPSLCTHKHQLSQGQILRGSTEFRTARQGNEVLSKDYRLVL